MGELTSTSKSQREPIEVPLSLPARQQLLHQIYDDSCAAFPKYPTSERFRETFLHTATDATLAHIEKAKEILDVDTLHPGILTAIASQNADVLCRNDNRQRQKNLPYSNRDLFRLMDSGVVGPGLSPGWLERKEFQGQYPSIPGIDSRLNEEGLYAFAPQSGVAFSRGAVLVSDGFSQCHGVLIYDRETQESAFAHCVYWDADPGQIEALERRWPHPGERELVYLYGSSSRRDYEQRMAEAVGATDIRTIEFPSGAWHWGAAYNPLTNRISCFRGGSNEVIDFPGFSERVYDKTFHESYSGIRRKEEAIFDAILQLRFQIVPPEALGVIDEKVMKNLAGMVSKLIRFEVSPGSLKRKMLKMGAAFEKESKLVVPLFFPAEHPTRDEEVSLIYEQRDQASAIKFYEFREFELFYSRLLARVSDNIVVSNRWASIVRRDRDRVGVMGSGNEIRFRADPESPFYHSILQEAIKIHKHQECEIRFTSAFNSGYGDSIRVPRPIDIEFWKEENELREL